MIFKFYLLRLDNGGLVFLTPKNPGFLQTGPVIHQHYLRQTTMLNKLKNLKEHFDQGRNAITFDASRFNDPLAEQIQWTSLKSGGSNFHSHTLTEMGPSRMEFKPTMKSKMFSMIFVILGIAFPVFFGMTAIDFAEPDALKFVGFISLFGLIFIGAGIFMYRKNSVPIVFDKISGRFWKGRNGPDKFPDKDTSDLAPYLRDVHAIQLISQYVKSDKSSYYVYEMNFVMKDTRRYNVIRHGGKRQIRRDAEKMSAFIGKPVWDAAG